MLLSFVLVVTPGSALMYFIYRFVKAKELVGVARIDLVRADARLEGARRAAVAAEDVGARAMAQTSQALAVAARIELVDDKVTSLADYLVARIEGGSAAQRRAGRHELPAGEAAPALAGGGSPEGGSS